MRAAIVRGPGQTPVFGEIDPPTAEPGSTLVHVAASALSNVTRARAAGSHYSSTAAFPFIPGIDGVGRTEDGRRVAFLLPTPPFGGLAETTIVRDALCLPVPDSLDDAYAAAIINPGQSPVAALRTRAGLRRGETVLVNGATGTTGQVAVQIARHLGAGRVIATGRNTDVLARLEKLGADHTVNLGEDADAVQDALAAHAANGGIDVVLDYLSGAPTESVLSAIARSHASAKPLRYVVAGTAGGSSTNVATSVLGSVPLVLMGSGIGALTGPEIIRAATEALEVAGAAELQIDLTEVPLADVEEAWTQDHHGSRVVFTV